MSRRRSPALPPLLANRFAKQVLHVLCWVSLPVVLSAVAAEPDASRTRLAGAVKFLASDDLEGRGVGTVGLDKAAEFIASEFAKAGLRTELFDGSAFQIFQEPADAELGPADQNTIQFVGPARDGETEPQRVALQLGDDFNPMSIGGSGDVQAPLVFAGYGISAKDPQYDDYAGIDVKGKILVILRKHPGQGDKKVAFNSSSGQRHALFNSKVSNAFQHGAAGVILVNDSFGVTQAKRGVQNARDEEVKKLIERRNEFKKNETPSADERQQYQSDIDKIIGRIEHFEQQLAMGSDKILQFGEGGQSSNWKTLPVYFATRAAIEPVVQAALGKSLTELEQQIDRELKPHSVSMAGWEAHCRAAVNHRQVDVKNVVGVLEGEGPLADETIVVGAHYDHLGQGGNGSLAPWTRAIHNGADDNASGTSTLLEVARRLASRPQKSRRRLMFIAFTAEERGLIGSSYYVKNPLVPLENTVAMLNMDMVGRLTDNKLVVYGTGTAAEFDGLIDGLNERYQFEITKKPTGYGPSDHQTFYEKKIPVFHFFTDTHSDYHRPSDDFGKINVDGMLRIAGLVTEIVDRIDSAEERPVYQKTKRPQVARGGNFPHFGSIPDYSSKEEGMALKGVREDGPADRAGLKGGDLIIRFGDRKIGSVVDFMNALTAHKAGDKVKVVARRKGEQVTVTVTLDPPR